MSIHIGNENIDRVYELLHCNGYFYGPAGLLEDDALLSLCKNFGKPSKSNRQVALVNSIRPEFMETANPNTLSSRYGLGPFPFHTDTAHWREPARYVILLCICPGSGGRKTLLIDLDQAFIDLDSKDVLRRDVWLIHEINEPFLCNISSVSNSETFYRYDRACMKPTTGAGKRSALIMEQAISVSKKIEISWEPGWLLIIDNFRMLHARGPSIHTDLDRHHKRVLTVTT